MSYRGSASQLMGFMCVMCEDIIAIVWDVVGNGNDHQFEICNVSNLFGMG